MKSIITTILILCFCSSLQSSEEEKVVKKTSFTFEVNNEKRPSRRYFEVIGATESNKTYPNDIFWIKSIYSEDGNQKINISINPSLTVPLKDRNGIWIQNKDDSPFKTSLAVRVTYTLSNGTQIRMPLNRILGSLPYLGGPNHEFNYLNYILSDINSEKQSSVKIEVPNREPIIFKDIKITGFRDAMIKFRSGKWENNQIESF